MTSIKEKSGEDDNNDTTMELFRPLFLYPKRCYHCKEWLVGDDYITYQTQFMHAKCYENGKFQSNKIPAPAPTSTMLLRSVLPNVGAHHNVPIKILQSKPSVALPLHTPIGTYQTLKQKGWNLHQILSNYQLTTLAPLITTGLIEWNEVQNLIDSQPLGFTLLLQKNLTLHQVRQICNAPTSRDMATLIQQKKLRLSREQWQSLHVNGDNYQKELGLTWAQWMQL